MGMMTMRILVTGGAGFIGSHFVRLLLRKEDTEVNNLDALRYSGNLENLRDVERHPRYAFIQGDICDRALVERVAREHRVAAIVNLAAETHVDRSILEPDGFVKTDMVGTAVLLETARTMGIRRFVQVSTDEVYGDVPRGRSKESAPLAPRSPYSASKAAGDLLALSYFTTFRLPVMITRGSNTFGPNQYPEKFIPLFVTNALEDQPLPLYGDGRSEEHTSELQSRLHLVCRLLLEKKKKKTHRSTKPTKHVRTLNSTEAQSTCPRSHQKPQYKRTSRTCNATLDLQQRSARHTTATS